MRRDWGPLQYVYGGLAALGMLLFGIAVGMTSGQCSNECDKDLAEGWFERPGAWEKWAQLGAAVLVAVPLVWAAVAAWRGDAKLAAQRACLAVVPLVIWIVIFSDA